ncbi:peptidoglycan DD-metalloendopeptidase family protein [uncultured Serinicoccus sp.]|uniref:M23 family metallopeptidase n=1 Tax=uncultured Serinicoccus sp. TaxID=735514 RepID=UPI002612F1E9|nr:peptidoglycan DD-metalloendopeptidase family protein [uncultured Serinicoccus sp.]
MLGIRAPATTDQERATHWGWPLAGVPEVARGFDPPARRWGAGHRGIDLVGVVGESVLATDAGVVTFSGVVAGVGVVSVTHADGLRSTYQPVSDRIGRGARVARGDRLAVLDGGGHCPIRDCLHLGAVRGRDTYVDPTPLLVGVELTLLPLAPGR